MTKNQILTYLALGLKVRRRNWIGYLYMENGVIYKHNGLTKGTKVGSLDVYSRASNKGEWEIVP